MKVDVAIGPLHGHRDPPPIQITVKIGRFTLVRIELPPADFALCLTGRLVEGTVTRADIIPGIGGKALPWPAPDTGDSSVGEPSNRARPAG